MSYQSEVLADAPAGYWRMDSASGEIVDISGNGNNSVASPGGELYLQTGAILTDPASTSIKLDGSADWFRIPDHGTIDLGDIYTLECWARLESTPAVTQSLIAKGVNAYSMQFTSTQAVRLTCVAVGDIVTSTTSLTADGDFHHIVATKNAATVKLYIDAIDRTGVVTNQTCTNNTNALLLGQDPDTATTPFDGWLDECAVYPTALSASRVLAHYDAALSAATAADDPPVGFSGRGAGW